MSSEIPATLLARLCKVADPLLVERYRAALGEVSGFSTRLDSVHIDCAGYSPQIARELGDPYYLGQGEDHPYFILLGVQQLGACRIQPNAGFSTHAFRDLVKQYRGEIADLTLREAMFGELAHGRTSFGCAADLGLIREVIAYVRTPSGRLETATELAGMKARLLGSDALWHDDAFLDEMLDRAKTVHGYLPPTGGIAEGHRIAAGPAYTPRFGGCYVIPYRATHLSPATAWVLSGSATRTETASHEGNREVVVEPLSIQTAIDFVTKADLAELTPSAERLDLKFVETMMDWVALDHLHHAGELDGVGGANRHKLASALRKRPDVPIEYLELEEARLKLSRPGDWIDLTRFTPVTQLRLLGLRADLPSEQAFVRHLQARLDPVNLPRAWNDAPDLVWTSLTTLSPQLLDMIPRWVESRRS